YDGVERGVGLGGQRRLLDLVQVLAVLDVRGTPEQDALEAARLAGDNERTDRREPPVVGSHRKPVSPSFEREPIPRSEPLELGSAGRDDGDRHTGAAAPAKAPDPLEPAKPHEPGDLRSQ